MTSSLSVHSPAADGGARPAPGSRVRRLQARIGAAHREAEGMPVARALLAGQVSPLQLAGLLRQLAPAYVLLEAHGPKIARALGAQDLPWDALARSAALDEDLRQLALLPETPMTATATAWRERLEALAVQAPHRLMAHLYVRYGGDLSGGQQLAIPANAVLKAAGLPSLGFWQFDQPCAALKCDLHRAFEQLQLSAIEEQELLDEAEAAFGITQQLLRGLADLPAWDSSRIQALLLKYDRPVPRYTSYPTAAAFHAEVGPTDLANALARPSAAPLSLYVHVPFCRHACWYCGCHRITTQLGSAVVAPYLRALGQELALLEHHAGGRRRLAQLHWGGGTPNYLTTAEQGQLWDLIARHFDLASDLDASLEVNPEFLSRDQVLQIRRLGFQRVSFGIQDADPLVQAAVNRVVPVGQLRDVMAWMREAAFLSVNVDLICGLPLQTPERFDTTLELVCALRPDRLSLFSFAYLPEHLPLQRRIAAADLPDRPTRLAMLQSAHQRLLAAGYEAIGMDHYALSSDSLAEAARTGQLHRNFQGYTTGGEWDLLGVGPTAISQFPQLLSQNFRDLRAYQAAVAAGQLPVERGVVVRDPDVLERAALIREVMCHFRVSFDRQRFPGEWQAFQGLAADGLVQLHDGDRQVEVQVTPEGRWLLRSVAAVFDPEQQRSARGAQLI